MKTEEHFNNILDDIISKIEDEKLLKDFFKNIGETITFGKQYSFLNILSILSQKEKAIYTEGFHTWRKKGRFPKKNTGIKIFAPVFKTIKKEDEEENEQEEQDEKKKLLLGFKLITVFDYTDTKGEKIQEIEEKIIKRNLYKKNAFGSPSETFEKTKKLMRYVIRQGYKLRFKDTGDAGGFTNGKEITIDKSFKKQSLAVLCHEYAHCKLHFNKKARSIDNIQKEVEAGIVSAIVIAKAGLNINKEAGYISFYAQQQDKEKKRKLIFEAFKFALPVAKEILTNI